MHDFVKTRKSITLCIVLLFFALTQAELTPYQAGIASASPHEAATSVVATSAPVHQLNLSQSQSPSYLPSLVPTWQRLDFAVLPSPRIGSSLTLNPINQIALLFGGYNATAGELNDLWLTDGLSWLQFHTPHSPEPRTGASLAYDEERQRAVLFGGIGGGAYLGDTWLFNGIDWLQQQPPVSPSPRTTASMAYDPEHNVIIMFGGLVDTGEYDEAVDEMWIWDGETWQQQFPALSPPARWGAVMVYDQARKSILLFGGTPGGGFWEDTWLWNGASWLEQHPLHHPAGRANFGMAYDEDSQKVILFGGQTDLEVDPTETWAWDGQDWSLLPARQAPPEELAYGAQLVYLPDLQAVMLYNDLREKILLPDDSFIFTESSEVWILTYQHAIFLPIIYGQ
jgi:hypothetical protein